MPTDPKYREVVAHMADADAAIDDMGQELASGGPSTAQTRAYVKAATGVAVAMVDLADAIRGHTDAGLAREAHP